MSGKIFFVLIAFIGSLASYAASPTENVLNESAKKAFNRQFPNSALESEIAFGDINNDGAIDFVALAHDLNNDYDDLKILVFLGTRDHHFQFYRASGSTYRHQRVSQSVYFNKKGAIFLYREGSGGCCTSWQENFHFQFRADNIVLIGAEISQFTRQHSPDDKGRSINFLTNELIDWQLTGHHRVEKKMKFPRADLLRLEQFNYEQFLSYAPKGSY